MTGGEPDVLLRGLNERLQSGLQPGLALQWTAGAAGPADLAHWAQRPGNDWAAMARQATSAGPGPTPDVVGQAITHGADYLADHRQVLLDALFHPQSWMDDLPSPAADSSAVRWTAWCWAVEALWDAATRQRSALLPADKAFAVPLAARMRFLVLAEPFRQDHLGRVPGTSTGSTRRAARSRGEQRAPEPQWPLRHVFGRDSAADLVGRARQARWTWRDHLNNFQDSPALTAARGRPITRDPMEEELDQLLLADTPASSPLTITTARASGTANNQVRVAVEPGADDLAVQADAIERHLLPRFRLGRVAQLAWPTGRDRWFAGAALAIGIAAMTLAVSGHPREGGWGAIAAYALIVTSGWWAGAQNTTPWMLRWPAAAALGLLALSGFSPTWWRDISPPTLSPGLPWTPAALLTASYGYLVVEASNHGVPRALAPLRSAAVILGGLWHSALVALLGVAVVLPTFAEDGEALHALLDTAAPTELLTLLATATGWCLAAGVFTQILWDDQPITATLAHRRWRTGSTP